jgi:CDP-diacylglycerol--serine O-phosphatidyltransferase
LIQTTAFAEPFHMSLPTLPRRRGIYILPNLFTTAALFCGFFAIVQAMNSHFESAAIAIFVAMLFDGLDGRIARLTQTQSEFGAEYDSLSDMVCFGAAPALVVYEWALIGMGKLGWIIAFIYCAGAALRLARFNTNIDVVDKRFFQGLPSPAAAVLVSGLVWVSIDNNTSGADVKWLAALLTFFGGISMVSNMPFWSGKSINLKKSVPFIVVIALVLAFALVATYPPGVFFGLFVAYALSGYVLYGWRWWQHHQHTGTPEDPHDVATIIPVDEDVEDVADEDVPDEDASGEDIPPEDIPSGDKPLTL